MNQDQNTNMNEVNSREKAKEPLRDLLHQEPDIPLFLRDGSEGKKGNAQDEKDKTTE